MDSNGVLSVSKYLKDLSAAVGGIALRYLSRSDKASIFADGLEALAQTKAYNNSLAVEGPVNTSEPAFNIDGTPMYGCFDIHGRVYGQISPNANRY